MEKISPLINLNELKNGIHKQWIWKDYFKSCDYLQKINYCIQDLNREIDFLQDSSMKDVVFTIVLIDWIREAVNALQGLIIDSVANTFSYSRQLELDKANKYFVALRSFAVAHPLSTDRHKAIGFDGDMICVDISKNVSMVIQPFTHTEDWYHLSYDGLIPNAKENSADFVLHVYSKQRDNMRFFKYIGVDYSDLFQVAELNVDKLYSLDIFLGRLKKKDWV